MLIVNKIRLLGEKLSDERIVEKIILTLPERFESKISSLEDSRDLSEITLSELVNALQAQEQRRAIRQEKTTEGTFYVKKQESHTGGERKKQKGESNKDGEKKKCLPWSHCKKTSHLERYCWQTKWEVLCLQSNRACREGL